MPLNRTDFLKQCNDQGVPEEDFRMAFCDRCRQEECVRSQARSGRFEQRVASWYETLFVNVPRLDAQDPRYATISAKNFIAVDVGRIPEVRSSSWEAPPTQEVGSVSTPPEVKRVLVSGVTPGQSSSLPQLNTPDPGFQMVGGAKPPTPQNEVLAKPGARVRLGGV